MRPILTALSRRDLLRSAIAAGVGIAWPGSSLFAAATTPAAPTARRLVLVELEGGNDGLNTVIPTKAVAEYYNTYSAKRAGIGYAAAATLALTANGGANSLDINGATFGLNPNLAELLPAWNDSTVAKQDLAIVLGVGYPNPNRSHFRGIDIIHTAQDGNDISPASSAWLNDVFTLGSNGGIIGGLNGHGVALAHYSDTPFRGGGTKDLAVETAQDFYDKAAGILAIPGSPGANASLAYVKSTIANILSGQGEIAQALSAPGVVAGTKAQNKAAWDSYWLARGVTVNTVVWNGNGSKFVERQCRAVAEIIASGVEIPVFRITLGGFDNHSGQRANHDDLLAQLGRGLSLLRKALMAVDTHEGTHYWDDTLVMTYSEFGRRIEENGSAGTDHGTAAPHFVLGGSVNGRALYGEQPRLNQPDARGDLQWKVDYRDMYASACSWIGLNAPASLGGFSGIPGLYTA